MKTRDDYADMQALAQKIAPDEPTFVIRAHDAAGPAAIQSWINRAAALGADPSILDSAQALRREMIEWQATRGAKVPDLPESQLTAEQEQERYRLQRLAHAAENETPAHSGRTISVEVTR